MPEPETLDEARELVADLIGFFGARHGRIELREAQLEELLTPWQQQVLQLVASTLVRLG